MPPFLTAHWRHLLMLNYAVDPAILEPFVPKGVTLDSFNGVTYVSVVGFLFLDTRVVGVPVPWHVNFEEVNLRFYVTPPDGRRAVVFIKEIVPRRAIAAVARLLYGERYVATRMRHRIDLRRGRLHAGGRVAYGWRVGGEWATLRATLTGQPAVPDEDSIQSFITEHYWGYAHQRDGGTVEYQVMHPRWPVWNVDSVRFTADIAGLYGPQFVDPLSQPPASAFVAEGSEVAVHFGKRIA